MSERSRREERRSRMRDKTKQVAKEREKTFGATTVNLPDGVEWLELKKGVMELDIIPYVVTEPKFSDGIPKGELWWRRKFKVHKNIGSESKTFVCLKSIEKPCPICEQLAPLYKKYKENKEILETNGAKDRDLILVIDRNDEDGKLRMLDISYHLFTKKLLEEIDEGKEEWADFAELEDGYTLIVRWAEKTFGEATFHEAARIDFEKRKETLKVKDVPSLDDVLNVVAYDELEKIFLEEDTVVSTEKTVENKEIKEEREDEGKDKATTKEKVKELEKQSIKRERKSDKSKDRCPSGGRFGIDADKLKDCSDCDNDLWNECMDKKEEGENK